MGLFDRFKKQPGGPVRNLQGEEEVMRYFVSSYIGNVILQQLALNDLVQEQPQWNVDLELGEIHFGSQHFPINVLGTEAGGEWLWGFANSSLPSRLVADAAIVHKSDFIQGNPYLKGVKLPVSQYVTGHNIATLCAAYLGEGFCYYRCPQGTVTVYVSVQLPDDLVIDKSPTRVARALQLAIQGQALEHPVLCEKTLHYACARVENVPQGLLGHWNNGDSLRISFDDQHRIANMQVQAS